MKKDRFSFAPLEWTKYATYDEDGFCGKEKLGIREDAPNYIKEQYKEWWRLKEEDERNIQ